MHATALPGPFTRTAPVTPMDIVLGVFGVGGIAGAGWIGKTVQERYKHRAREREIAAGAEAEEHRHGETLIGALMAQMNRSEDRQTAQQSEHARQMDGLQMKIDHANSEVLRTAGTLQAVIERLEATKEELIAMREENKILRAENISLRHRVTALTGRVGDLRLELERHGVKCPPHPDDPTDPTDLPEATTVMTTGQVIVMPTPPESGK